MPGKRKRTSELSQEHSSSSAVASQIGASCRKKIRSDIFLQAVNLPPSIFRCRFSKKAVVPIPRFDDVKIPRHFCHICDKFIENGATLEVHIREHVDAVNPPDKEKVIASFVAKGCITKSETLWCYQTPCGKNVAVIRCYYLGTSCQFTMQKEI